MGVYVGMAPHEIRAYGFHGAPSFNGCTEILDGGYQRLKVFRVKMQKG